jgi:hypothetical protein
MTAEHVAQLILASHPYILHGFIVFILGRINYMFLHLLFTGMHMLQNYPNELPWIFSIFLANELMTHGPWHVLLIYYDWTYECL